MKIETLQKISKLIKSFLKSKETKDWIEPDDKRYTKIVKKYSKQLSIHWNKTRDEYLKKLDKKKSIDIDFNPEDYEDPQYNSSTYIDEALKLIAFAFGEGVAIGFNEAQSRGFDTEGLSINIFDEAKEEKNYIWAALSYEQMQMDDTYKMYNNDKEANQIINDWFKKNEYRLTDLMISGAVWYAINFGFSKAVLSNKETNLYWLTEKDKKVCGDCKKLEDGNPYNNDNPLHTLPGGGKTICGSRCRCLLDISPR